MMKIGIKVQWADCILIWRSLGLYRVQSCTELYKVPALPFTHYVILITSLNLHFIIHKME